MKSITSAQQPSHFFIGKEDFANSKIYSLLVENENQLFVTTNYGFFIYQNGTFKAIPLGQQQGGSSLYSLVSNSHNEIFCCNLSGQIFVLKDDKLVLFAELPQEHLGPDIQIAFNHKDELIVRSKSYMLFSKDEWKFLDSSTYCATVGMNSFIKNRILLPENSSDKIFALKGDSILNFDAKNIQNRSEAGEFQFPAFLNKSLVSIYNDGLCINHQNNSTTHQTLLEVRVLSQFEDNEIWGLNRSKGIHRIRLIEDEFQISDVLIPNHFISAIAKSKNGTIYLGTFDKGIIVIPKMTSEIITGPVESYSRITSSEDEIFVLGAKGFIYKVSSDGIQYMEKNGTHPRGQIFTLPGISFGLEEKDDHLFYDDYRNDKVTYLGHVKAVCRLDESSALIATNHGIFRRGNAASHLNWTPTSFDDKWGRLKTDDFRSQAVAFDTLNKTLYYANQHKILMIDEDGTESELLFKNSHLNCNQLLFANGYIWCGSQNSGILQISDGKIVKQFNKDSGLRSNYIRKFQWYKNKLYISHKAGFQIIDLTSFKLNSVGKAEGIPNGSISDFTVFKNKLWVLSNGKLIRLPLNEVEKTPDFKLLIPSVRLGDSLIDRSKETTYAYDQNHLVILFDFRGIEFETEAEIYYRLLGLNDEWKKLDARTESLEFNALAPGKFKFESKVIYRNFESDIQSFSFSINPPFWQTWWFYSILIIGSAGIVFILFRIRIKRTKKEQFQKLEKEKMRTNMLDSELKALRSQMNPHFIFNSLNSIQDLVLQEDKERSYDYIVLFAKLVRNTLNYSNTDFIPIDKELEFLDVYLSLEKLRFGDQFEYNVLYKNEKNVMVPSMLVQPFIENALVHGLMHKKGLKKLSITFEMTDQLVCTIIDNGVGRAKSNEIQERQNRKHESFALAAIEQRLNLINNQVGENRGSFEMTDLFENGIATGTKVEIIIPFNKLTEGK